MAPGGKKKNFNRKGDNQQDNKKNNLKIINKDVDNNSQIPSKNEYEENNSQDTKYNKRSIIKNWEKYEDVHVDTHADALRGEDFEVLLSYSGGSGSQLKLQDEKEWEEVSIDEKVISLDVKDIVHVVKSISFPKQINLPLNIFSKEQLSKFECSAKNWRISYMSNLNIVNDNMKEKQDAVQDTLDPDLNIINICDDGDTEETVLSKSVHLEEKTETIIESLASCLSLKDTISEVNTSTVAEIKKDCEPDELDFLLSLNVSLKNPVQDQKQSESKTNVDDWLNSILDD